MCIRASVGRNCANTKDDVKTIQVLLNLNNYRLDGLSLLSEDGGIGPKTLAAIDLFQTNVVGMGDPDGIVDPGGSTLLKMKEGLDDTFSKAKLKGIMIHASQSHIDTYFEPLLQKMKENGIDTTLRIVHFLAQIGHESGEFQYEEELASGAAYEGRKDLGNTKKGDGVKFKGRGLIQLTGRANYKSYSDARGVDYISNPELIASDPFVAVDVACWYWTTHKLNDYADQDDVRTVTKIINGGFNGLENREELLARSKFFLA